MSESLKGACRTRRQRPLTNSTLDIEQPDELVAYLRAGPQAYAIARAYGVEDALAHEGVESDRVVRAGQKAWRWSPEMDEVADTYESLGLPNGIAHGAAAVFVRWAARRDNPAQLDELLDELGR